MNYPVYDEKNSKETQLMLKIIDNLIQTLVFDKNLENIDRYNIFQYVNTFAPKDLNKGVYIKLFKVNPDLDMENIFQSLNISFLKEVKKEFWDELVVSSNSPLNIRIPNITEKPLNLDFINVLEKDNIDNTKTYEYYYVSNKYDRKVNVVFLLNDDQNKHIINQGISYPEIFTSIRLSIEK